MPVGLQNPDRPAHWKDYKLAVAFFYWTAEMVYQIPLYQRNQAARVLGFVGTLGGSGFRMFYGGWDCEGRLTFVLRVGKGSREIIRQGSLDMCMINQGFYFTFTRQQSGSPVASWTTRFLHSRKTGNGARKRSPRELLETRELLEMWDIRRTI